MAPRYNFKPSIKHRTLSLQEAEDSIRGRKTQLEVAGMNARLSKMADEVVAMDMDSGRDGAEGEGGGGRGRRGGGGGGGGAFSSRFGSGAGGSGWDGAGGGGDGDWEHQEEYADDDEALAVEAEDKERVQADQQRPPEGDPRGEEMEARLDETDGPMSAIVREQMEMQEEAQDDPYGKLRELMEDGGAEAGGDAGEPKEEDLEDLDAQMEAMADGLVGGRDDGGSAFPDMPQVGGAPAPGEGAGKRAREPAAAEPQPKRPRPAVPVSGAVTEREIRELLQRSGRMLISEIADAFKKRLKTKGEKDRFLKSVKRVTKLVSHGGRKFVELKE